MYLLQPVASQLACALCRMVSVQAPLRAAPDGVRRGHASPRGSLTGLRGSSGAALVPGLGAVTRAAAGRSGALGNWWWCACEPWHCRKRRRAKCKARRQGVASAPDWQQSSQQGSSAGGSHKGCCRPGEASAPEAASRAAAAGRLGRRHLAGSCLRLR